MKTILTVDDSSSVRQMVKITLTSAGYAVVEACDGKDGLAKAKSHSVNLVITDQNGNVVDPSTFGITITSLTGVSALDGANAVAAGNQITAQYTLIPSLGAAANGPTEYNIGGSITFNEADGDPTTTTILAPVTVTVLPQPVRFS